MRLFVKQHGQYIIVYNGDTELYEVYEISEHGDVKLVITAGTVWLYPDFYEAGRTVKAIHSTDKILEILKKVDPSLYHEQKKVLESYQRSYL